MKISVITPSVRPENLKIIAKCLMRQDFKEWEWLIISPKLANLSFLPKMGLYAPSLTNPEGVGCFRLLADPEKREGDFYRLCGAWNRGFNEAKGELIISIQDGIWFPPDMLSRLWTHYQNNPKGLVTAIGHQYDQIDKLGKPTNLMWQDPRARMDQGSFYEVAPSEMEFAVCSVPKQALIGCGGIDEEYDKGAAVGEKEMCFRLDKLGYKFYIDQTIEYRAIHHPRLTKDWDEKYKISSAIFIEHMRQLDENQRTLNVGFVK